MTRQRSISVSIGEQKLYFKIGAIERIYTVSTSSRGTGCEPGSFKTPLGLFVIAEKIGGGMPDGTIFKARKPVGTWPGDLPQNVAMEDDLVLTRILWLDGLDEENKTTYGRYIYIHGTNHEDRLGIASSCGCVRMANHDIMELYDMVEVGTVVEIKA